MSNSTAEVSNLIDRFQLIPHPEGGWYREMHRSKLNVIRGDSDKRSAFTMILFLLPSGQVSRWHRVANADESWHYIAGEPLELFSLSPDGGIPNKILLGFSIDDDKLLPVSVIPAGFWQAAQSSGEWSLVSCCVGPGFSFEDFSLLADHPINEHPLGAVTNFI